jgi:protein-tyrosine phosphatase
MFGASEFASGLLFVGDSNVARDLDFLKKNKITLIVNMTTNVRNYFPEQYEYINLPVEDHPDAVYNKVMAHHLRRVVPIIMNRIMHNEAVLIHCWAGVSRSCTVLAAVLRACCYSTLDECFRVILAKRPSAFYGGLHFYFMPALIEVCGKDKK